MISQKLSQVIYGGEFQPQAWPETLWTEDVALMRRAGVNCVTIAATSRSSLEKNGGENLDWLQRALDLLHSNRIFAGLSSVWPTPTESQDFSPEHTRCPNHPTHCEMALQWTRALASRFAAHPALLFWHIAPPIVDGQEEACRCEACAAKFRLWLQDRYRTLDVLNQQWCTSTTARVLKSWDEIIPTPCDTGADPGRVLDYRRFVSDSWLARVLDQKSALRELNPEIPVAISIPAEYGLTSSVDAFAWARHAEVLCCNASSNPLSTDPAESAFIHDVQRGLAAGKPWILRHVPNPSHPGAPRPGQIKLWSVQAIAHGADGILFSQWRAPSGGRGRFQHAMLPHGFTETRAFAETEQLGAELKKFSASRGTSTRAEVAMILDWESQWALQSEPMFASVDYADVLRSYYRALFDPDVPIDIISADAELSSYKLVLAPALHLIRDGVAERLEAFVDAGGTFLTTFLSGLVDASARVLPGGYPAPFRTLLGLRVEEFDPLGDQVRHIKTAMRGARCSTWADVIQMETAEAIATFTEDFHAHRAAITRNPLGRGLAYYVGTQPEPSFLRSFLAELCRDCGVKPPMRAPAGVEVTSRSGEHGEFLFLLNHTTTIQFVDIGLRTRRDLSTGEMIRGQCELGPRETRILQLA